MATINAYTVYNPTNYLRNQYGEEYPQYTGTPENVAWSFVMSSVDPTPIATPDGVSKSESGVYNGICTVEITDGSLAPNTLYLRAHKFSDISNVGFTKTIIVNPAL